MKKGKGKVAERMAVAGKKEKGFVFGADAVLAVLVFTLAFFSITLTLSQQPLDLVGRMQMKQAFDDAFSVLDREQALQCTACDEAYAAAVEAQLDELLPDNYKWKALVERYEPGDTSFDLAESVEFGDTTADLTTKDFVKGRRMVVRVDGTDEGVTQYYNVEYWAWLS